MIKLSAVIAATALVPALAFSTPALAATSPFDPNFYGVANVTQNEFASPKPTTKASKCGDEMLFVMVAWNRGEQPIYNVIAGATLPSSTGAEIVSTATLDGTVEPKAGVSETSTASVTMLPNSHLEYIKGSTVMAYVDENGEYIQEELEDGLINDRFQIADEMAAEDMIAVGFSAEVVCNANPQPNDDNSTPQSGSGVIKNALQNGIAPVVNTPSKSTGMLVKTGPSAAIASAIAAVAAVSAVAYNVVLRRKASN